MRRHELTDEEWAIIAPRLPNKARGVARVEQVVGEKKPPTGTSETDPASGPQSCHQGIRLGITCTNMPPLPKNHLETANLIPPK